MSKACSTALLTDCVTDRDGERESSLTVNNVMVHMSKRHHYIGMEVRINSIGKCLKYVLKRYNV